MSDANTDIALDEERSRRRAVYVAALKDYLRETTCEKLQKTLNAARFLDELRGWGYFSGPTSESAKLGTWLDMLIRGDEQEWVDLIKRLEGSPDYEEFKAMSPIYKRYEIN